MRRHTLARAVTLITLALLFGQASAHGANEDHVKRILDTNECAGCDLIRVDLRGAVLFGADLRGAKLSEARLSKADLSGAFYSSKTKFPDYLDPVEAKMIKK